MNAATVFSRVRPAIINTHYNFYFGRTMRFRTDERILYKKLWDHLQASNFKIRE
ncbi:MAG: hypothetical protein QF473_38395 [Planctomycetota bacterium]|nr:hypothetical protein [Planctomycetota bacterium]